MCHPVNAMSMTHSQYLSQDKMIAFILTAVEVRTVMPRLCVCLPPVSVPVSISTGAVWIGGRGLDPGPGGAGSDSDMMIVGGTLELMLVRARSAVPVPVPVPVLA